MKNKISIIVPIYNGENTLKLCLESIKKQTYTNFEVLLVNDGSIDKSAEICKSYCIEDNRFVYIEKENGGVSSARNIGLDKMTGSYVAFIDCDDTVSSNYLEFLLDNMVKHKANIGAVRFNFIDKCYIVDNESNKNYNIFNKNDFLTNLVIGKGFSSGCGNKIYKRSLIKNIRFKDVSVAEDLYFNYEIAHNNENICVFFSDSKLYNYFISHNNSVMHGFFSQKNLDVIKQYEILLDKSKDKYDEFNKCLSASFVFISIKLILKMVSSSFYNEEIYEYCNRIIYNNKKYVFKSNNYSIIKKIFVAIFDLFKLNIEKSYNKNCLTKKVCCFLNKKVG